MKCRLIFIILFIVGGAIIRAQAQAPVITGITNAANYSTSFAPGSIVSIFGLNLANADGSGVQVLACLEGLPCAAARIDYSSPVQINAALPVIYPSRATTPPGVGSGTIQIQVRTPIPVTIAFTANLPEASPGIFREAWDCQFPTVCQLAGAQSSRNSVWRGSVTDEYGNMISSMNPISGSTGEFVIYSTGSGYSEATYAYLIAPGKTSGVVVFPDYVGPSPCCQGLDQYNFHLPADLLRAFTANDEAPATCGSLPALVQTEMTLLLTDALTLGGTARDSVSVPMMIQTSQFDCTPVQP